MSGRVFVTDAQQRNALAIIRSLGKKNISVCAGEDTRFATSFYSKYCDDYFVYPNAEKNSQRFVEQLLEVVKEGQYNALFPVTNATVIPIVKNLKKFSKHTHVPLVNENIMMNAMDKGATIKIAQSVNIPCPKTFFIKDVSELEEIKQEIDYPVIVKPRIGYGARGVDLCKNPEELDFAYKNNLQNFGHSLIQEYLPRGGDEIGVYTLFNYDSEPRAVTVHRRIRSYPHTGGPSTLRETIEYPELVEQSFKLLQEFKWFGVAMVEYKVDPRDGIPKLMEINPRWWGSLPLSIFAGVDFPYLLYRLVMDGEIEKDLNYKIGVKCRWMLPGDVLHLLTAPNKPYVFKEFIKFKSKDMGYDILSSDDPGPSAGFILAVLRYLFDKDMWSFVIRKPLMESN